MDALPEGWVPLTAEAARRAEAELVRELVPKHSLHGRKATAIARRLAQDDFLFQLDGSAVAEVHLTFGAELSPHWPLARVFSSIQDWISAMRDGS